VSQLIDVLSDQLAQASARDRCADALAEGPCRELVEGVDALVYIHDLEGRIRSVNGAVEAVTGYRREDALGMHLADLLTPESLDLNRRMTAAKLGGGSGPSYEITVRTKDGSQKRLEVTSRLLFDSGAPAGVITVARPTRDRRALGSDLRLLKSVVVNANDAVLIAEAKPGDPLGGRIVYVNEAFTRMTGYSAGEAIGRTPRILLGPQTDRDQLNHVRQALSNCAGVRVELINYRKDGSAYWVDVNFVPITEETGQFTHWVAVQRETTHRRQAEELERDRNRVLEMVARNEPLEVVLAQLAQMVERQCPDLRCTLLLFHGGELVPAAGAKLPGGALRDFRKLDVETLSSASEQSRYRELLPGPHMGANWTVPILSGAGAVLGAFALYCGVTRKPAEAELDLIGKAGRLAAIAIEQRQLTNRLAHQAQHDPLTGLPNRALFEERLHGALAQARKHGWHTAVLFVDLDRFKQINDTLGHSVGDALLQQVARRLEDCLRKTDTLARMGGDEFTVLLSELPDYQYSQKVAQKLLDSLKAPFHVEGYELFVSASIGISTFPRDGADAATLERNADSAMYRAKSRGRNSFQMFMPEIGASALESLELENALRRALEHGELQLRYQPQTDIDGHLTGLEALMVWNHPKLGVIPPAQFIPLAEECGLIIPLGDWALREACRQRAQWQRCWPGPAKVAVNVSVTQFTRAGFVDSVARALKETGLDPSLLELELTESVVMRDIKESAWQMEQLRHLGVSLSIDDFGTGYSSLSYLRMLPIHTLKIDQSFLREVDSDPNTVPLVRAIVALAHSLQLCVVAEGVESERQLEALRSVGCDRVQGYLIGEPVHAEQAAQLLRSAWEQGSGSPEERQDAKKSLRPSTFCAAG
jgi:diguanylate cyclase (GGDEF)-like protein/PAS domain S-box-containing protein